MRAAAEVDNQFVCRKGTIVRTSQIDNVGRSRRIPLSSQAWLAYFENNRDSMLRIPWSRGAELTLEEKVAISDSVARFQLGESGQGRHFLRVARKYADRTADAEDAFYVDALQMFVAEEQRHAELLGRFLDLAEVPRIQQEWSNHCFRRLRHLAGLELIISVLLTAEIIARVYYAALRRATDSTVLKRICEQLLRDEVMHIRFQAERLARIRRRLPCWRNRLAVRMQRLLFGATCVVVWIGHYHALRRGGLTFSEFWKRSHGEFRVASKLMDPGRYEILADWPPPRPGAVRVKVAC